ncbi:hypothetical protein FACS189451_10150 [Bacteroidia bacterium]|nr:hypothetical protein FACS189451_10150 [Bacteroidia bacterium]
MATLHYRRCLHRADRRGRVAVDLGEKCTEPLPLLLSEDNFNEKISVSALPKGVYLLKVYTEKGIAVSKVVKE